MSAGVFYTKPGMWNTAKQMFSVQWGQGTIGLEMLADDPALDTLVVPIGGGGLISGIATAACATKPDVEVVGVEAALYPSMSDALQQRAPRCYVVFRLSRRRVVFVFTTHFNPARKP